MSLLSFGENFEMIVASQADGSIVKLLAKSKIMWNMTADTKNSAARIFDLLDEKLGCAHDPPKD